MKTLFRIAGNVIGQAIYWHVRGAQKALNAYFNRPAGFNPTVDERRLLTIKMKLFRGQIFITADDARFLIRQLEEK